MFRGNRLVRRLEEEGADILRLLDEKMPLFADVLESEDEVLVLVDLAGCEKDSIDIRYESLDRGGRLSVEARKEKPLESGFRYVLEGRSNHVEGGVRLKSDVDFAAADTSYENGLLRIRLPRVRGERIEIE